MRLAVDTPLRVGETTLAAVTECRAAVHCVIGGVLISGQKTPVAIIVRRLTKVVVFRPDGTDLSLERLKKMCRKSPDALQSIAEFCADV